MRLLTLFFVLIVFALNAQNYPFVNSFVEAEITLRDSTVKEGLLDWQLHRENNVRFKNKMNEVPEAIKPKDLLGFRVDTLRFVPLFKVTVYGMPFARLGIKTKISDTFAEVIHEGEFNIYKVVAIIRDPVDGDHTKTINYVFERNGERASYPENLQLNTRRLKKSKKAVLKLFEGYPTVVNEIQYHKWQEPVDAIIAEAIKL